MQMFPKERYIHNLLDTNDLIGVESGCTNQMIPFFNWNQQTLWIWKKYTNWIFLSFYSSKKEAQVSKYAFPTEEEDQDDSLNISKQSSYGASSSSHLPVSYPTKYEATKQLQMAQHPPAGPSVLDKFGNFRRAEQQSDASDKPPEPPYRSRSHSRTRSSRSCKYILNVKF